MFESSFTTKRRETNLCFQFFEQGVIQPQEDVPSPMPLLVPRRRYLSDSSFVNLPHSLDGVLAVSISSARVFFQSRVIEPDVVVPRFVREFFLVLKSSFTEDSHLDAGPRAMLFLEIRVSGVKLSRSRARQSIKSELDTGKRQLNSNLQWERSLFATHFVDNSRSIIFLQTDFHLRET